MHDFDHWIDLNLIQWQYLSRYGPGINCHVSKTGGGYLATHHCQMAGKYSPKVFSSHGVGTENDKASTI